MALTAVAAQGQRAFYREVADYVGVPADLFYAMALAESGRVRDRTFAPWPWTLNIEGEAQFHPDRESMFAALMEALRADRLRVDVGPLQVNWYWQFDRLQSPWRITDPAVGAKIGAEILKQQYRRSGDWATAVGHYHRPGDATPADRALAARYRERVWQLLEREHAPAAPPQDEVIADAR
jgi:hypothetical protein